MNQLDETTLIPIGLVITIVVAVISVYKWVDSVRDVTKDNRALIDALAKEDENHKREHESHREIHNKLQLDIENLKKEGQMIISDIANLRTELRTDIATLSTKIDVLLDYFKKNN